MKHSFAMQKRAVTHAKAHYEKDNPQLAEILGEAEQTLSFLEKHAELYREVHRLNERAPELSALLTSIPGLQIVGVR